LDKIESLLPALEAAQVSNIIPLITKDAPEPAEWSPGGKVIQLFPDAA
jgi:hypothetical protein